MLTDSQIDSIIKDLFDKLEFKGEPTIVKKLETAYRRDERVIRFLTFRLDKYAVEYAEKRRRVRAEKAAQPAAAVENNENKEEK